MVPPTVGVVVHHVDDGITSTTNQDMYFHRTTTRGGVGAKLQVLGNVRKRGVIVTLSASLGKEARPFMSGVSSACGAIEAMTRGLAAELSPAGVRVVCVRPGAMFETRTIQETIRANAATAGIPEEAFKDAIRMGALMQRAVTVDETANIVVLVASDMASCLTGQVVDASCGMVLH
ncbi:MAG: SDR family oxidoreductase [Labilithrix sp.]